MESSADAAGHRRPGSGAGRGAGWSGEGAGVIGGDGKVWARETAVVQLESSADAAGRRRAGSGAGAQADRKSTRLNSSHSGESRMPSSA